MSKKDTAQFWDTAHRYLDHQLKVIRQVSSHTIDSYRDCLNSFINYLERVENVGRKKISFHNFEKETIKRYQTWMIMEQGLAPKTCNRCQDKIFCYLAYFHPRVFSSPRISSPNTLPASPTGKTCIPHKKSHIAPCGSHPR